MSKHGLCAEVLKYVWTAFMREASKMSDERTIKILNQLKEDLDMALIKAKAQLEYVDDDEPCSCRTCDMIARGYEENEI